MSLQNEAVIVRLSIGQWTARKLDKIVSKETAVRYNAEPESGRYNKLLIAKEELSEINRIASKARVFHDKNSVPWDDAGGRILPAVHFLDYTKEMNRLKIEFDNAWRKFVDERYDSLREKARARLGNMYHDADYPRRSQLSGKFRFTVDIEPVPISEDFRVTLQKSDEKRVKKELESRLQASLTAATKDLFNRLVTVIEHFVEKVSDKDSIFRDSLLGNIEELVVLLPRLNVANDPELASVITAIKRNILVYEPDVIRKDPKVRTTAAADADAILAKMSGYVKRLK